MELFGYKKGLRQVMVNHKYFIVHFLSIVFCFWFSTFIYIPVFGIYLELKNIGYYGTGLIMGSYGIMQIVIRFPMGIIADKYKISGKILVSIGFFASIISALFLALSDGFLPIFWGRFFAGVTAAMWVVLTIWYSSAFEGNRLLKAMGQLQATTVVSQLIGMGISGWIASLFGHTSLFWIGAFFAVIGLILVITLHEHSETKRNTFKQEDGMKGKSVIKITLKNKKLWLLSILSLLAHAVLFATIFGFSSVFLTQLNNHSSSITILVIAFMFPHALAPILLSISKRTITSTFRLLIICFGLGAVSLIFIWYVESWIVYCLLHMILGLTLGFVFPVLLDQVYNAGNIKGSKATMGFFQSIYSIGIVGGPLIAGYFARLINLEAVFIISAGLLFLGVIIATVGVMIISKEKRVVVQEIKS